MDFSGYKFDRTASKDEQWGQNSAPQVSALWPDAVLSVAVSWYFQVAVVLRSGEGLLVSSQVLRAYQRCGSVGWCPDRLFR